MRPFASYIQLFTIIPLVCTGVADIKAVHLQNSPPKCMVKF